MLCTTLEKGLYQIRLENNNSKGYEKILVKNTAAMQEKRIERKKQCVFKAYFGKILCSALVTVPDKRSG